MEALTPLSALEGDIKGTAPRGEFYAEFFLSFGSFDLRNRDGFYDENEG